MPSWALWVKRAIRPQEVPALVRAGMRDVCQLLQWIMRNAEREPWAGGYRLWRHDLLNYNCIF